MTTSRDGPLETLRDIKLRYEDTAVKLFREQANKMTVKYLSYSENRRSYSYSCNGNTAVVVYRKNNYVKKTDEKPVESQFCVIL